MRYFVYRFWLLIVLGGLALVSGALALAESR